MSWEPLERRSPAKVQAPCRHIWGRMGWRRRSQHVGHGRGRLLVQRLRVYLITSSRDVRAGGGRGVGHSPELHLKWSPQRSAWKWVGCRGGFIRLAAHGTRKSQAHARQPPQKRHTHALQAAKLRSPLRPWCSHLRARCLQNRCQYAQPGSPLPLPKAPLGVTVR